MSQYVAVYQCEDRRRAFKWERSYYFGARDLDEAQGYVGRETHSPVDSDIAFHLLELKELNTRIIRQKV